MEDLVFWPQKPAALLILWNQTFFEKLETVVLDIDDMYDTIIEYYPMLKIAARWIDEEDVEMVAEYVDSINTSKKETE